MFAPFFFFLSRGSAVGRRTDALDELCEDARVGLDQAPVSCHGGCGRGGGFGVGSGGGGRADTRSRKVRAISRAAAARGKGGGRPSMACVCVCVCVCVRVCNSRVDLPSYTCTPDSTVTAGTPLPSGA